jgi:hypothetical protein
MPLNDVSQSVGDGLSWAPSFASGVTSQTVNIANYYRLGAQLIVVEIDVDFTNNNADVVFSLPIPIITQSNPYRYGIGTYVQSGGFNGGSIFQVGFRTDTSALDTTKCSVYTANFGAWPGSGTSAFSGHFAYPAAG